MGAQAGASLYLVATGGDPRGKGGDNPAIALLTVVGSRIVTHDRAANLHTYGSTHGNFVRSISGRTGYLRKLRRRVFLAR